LAGWADLSRVGWKGGSATTETLVGMSLALKAAGKSSTPGESHLVTAPEGLQTDRRATPTSWVGSPLESAPPGTWTESGQTPILQRVSSSPVRRTHHMQ
jgi:hypothetical protein